MNNFLLLPDQYIRTMSSATPSVIKGSCFCKGIQYEFNSGTAQWIICPCSMCNKTIGGDIFTFFAAPYRKLKFKAKETMKTFKSSKEAERWFCGNCGCSVFMKCFVEPNTIWVTASSLDHEIPATRPTGVFGQDMPYWMDTMSSVSHSADISNWEVNCAKDL